MAPVDFTGTWIKTDIQGDPDAFLKVCGWSYVGRTAVKAIGYGKGRHRHIIAQVQCLCVMCQRVYVCFLSRLCVLSIKAIGHGKADTAYFTWVANLEDES